MKHWFTYPLIAHPYDPEFVRGDSLTRIAQAAEAAGFSGIGFTDHPAPSHKWLVAGGHDALDPFVALGHVAAVTRTLRLIPNIVVLPYRNPFLVAKAAATLDSLSGGRFTLSVATGYQKAEYRALGVDFDQRNELFDEALDVIGRAWREEQVAVEGSGFSARDVTANPQPEHVPVWIGGNSALTRRRVAERGDGWNPFRANPIVARTTKTPALQTLDELAVLIDDLHRLLDAAGRDPASVDIAFSASGSGEAHLAELDRIEQLGVTWNGVTVPGDSVAHAIEEIERYGAEVIRV